jgi:hypothetical protein
VSLCFADFKIKIRKSQVVREKIKSTGWGWNAWGFDGRSSDVMYVCLCELPFMPFSSPTIGMHAQDTVKTLSLTKR